MRANKPIICCLLIISHATIGGTKKTPYKVIGDRLGKLKEDALNLIDEIQIVGPIDKFLSKLIDDLDDLQNDLESLKMPKITKRLLMENLKMIKKIAVQVKIQSKHFVDGNKDRFKNVIKSMISVGIDGVRGIVDRSSDGNGSMDDIIKVVVDYEKAFDSLLVSVQKGST